MSNYTATPVDNGSVMLGPGEFTDGPLVFGAGGTEPAGTLLALTTDGGANNNKFVPYVVGGTANVNGVPVAVLTEPAEAASAGDVKVRALTAGTVALERLIVKAAGDSSTITAAVKSLLASRGIHASPTAELNS